MPDIMTMRRGTAGDAALIRALTRTAYQAWIAVIGREPLPMTADYEEVLRRHRFDLLESAGAMVALIETVAKPDHLLVVNVAVHPAFQGRGLGRRLLAHAEDLAASAGLNETRLYLNKLYVRNLRLYGEFGYCVDREEPFMGGWMVHMSKRLPSPR